MIQAAWKHDGTNARQAEQNEVRTPISVINIFLATALLFEKQIMFKKKVSCMIQITQIL
jgi:hypothetical protein